VATQPYKVHLPVYEGPLDLLLDLIRKQEMDIHNIPIATITSQYLDYLHKLEQLDMDISADFVYMAATLILIKSKMLLPADPLAGPEEQEDPRAELIHRLVEHEKFKSAAQLLHQKQQIEAHVWSKPDLSLYDGDAVEGELVVSLVDLVRVFQQVLERRKQVTRIELRHDEFTVAQMMQVLRSSLAAADKEMDLREFFESCPSRLAMICALLAVLEMVRLGAILLVQGELFSSIQIRKHKMFDAVFANGIPQSVSQDDAIDGQPTDGGAASGEAEVRASESPQGEESSSGPDNLEENALDKNSLDNIDEQYK